MTEGISIIICCYNSASRIRETLYHLSLQKIENCPAWEIIVVNNNSTDETEKITSQAATEFGIKNLKIIQEKNPGLMQARMAGGDQAAFSILSFIDDDNHVETKWIDKVHSIFSVYPDVSVCGGSSTAKLDSAPPDWFNAFSFAYAVGKQQSKSGYVDPQRAFLWGAGLSVRKEVWDEAKQNNSNFLLTGRKGKALSAGEDSELCLFWQLKNRKLWYQEDLRFVHYISKDRLTKAYLEKLFAGFGSSEVILRLYRSVLYSEPIVFTHELRSAAKNSILYTLKSVVLSSFISDPVKQLDIQTKRRYYSAYLKTLINIRSEYSHLIRSISELKMK